MRNVHYITAKWLKRILKVLQGEASCNRQAPTRWNAGPFETDLSWMSKGWFQVPSATVDKRHKVTVVENKRLDALLSFTDDLVKSTHFLSKEEHLIFEACKNLYNYLYSVTKDPKNLLRLCVLYQNRYKRLPAEVIDVSFEAIKCAGHPDAVVYFCKSVLHNLSANDALSRLSEVKKLLSQKKNSADVVKVFEACLLWRAGDMDGYTCLLKDFLECKNKEFNPMLRFQYRQLGFTLMPLRFQLVRNEKAHSIIRLCSLTMIHVTSYRFPATQDTLPNMAAIFYAL